MKKNFQDQFESMRNIMKSNVNTIKNLLIQSDNLSTIICDLTSQGNNTDTITNLQKLRKDIEKSIESLVKQSENLFDTYQKLTEEVFGKQS